MKKYILIITLILICLLSLNIKLNAETKNQEIDFKIGYGFPTNQNNKYHNAIAFGMNYDLGNAIFDKLEFKPGFDIFQLSTDNKNAILFSVHADWYYYQNIKSNKFFGFIGFAPAANFYINSFDYEKNYSCVGLDLFCGLEYWLKSNIAVSTELRESITDIMGLERNITKIYLGCNYKF